MALDDRTPRQDAIELILATQGPAELFPILARNPFARDLTLISEFEMIAADLTRSGQSGAAVRVEHIARIIRAAFDRANALAQVATREELLEQLRESTIMWASTFYDFAEAVAEEAGATDPARARLLRRGLAVREQMQSGLTTLQRVCTYPATTYDALISTPILRDPLFHEYVLLFVRNCIDDPQQSEAWRRAIAGLVESGRHLAEMEAQSCFQPITFDQAAAWHVFGVSDAFESVMRVAASVAAAGLASLSDVLQRLIALALRESSDQATAMLAMTFLENACRMEPAAAPMFIAEMRRVVGLDIEYPDRQRATHVLHYAMSLLLRWRSMPNTPEVLADAEQLVANAIPEVDSIRGARLVRDLHWNRGQLLQNLGEWNPQCFAEAVYEFRIALNTPPRLQHEHVPRALIQSDLANALKQSHLHSGTLTNKIEEEREHLYNGALQLLSADNEPWRRSIILANAAIFLNELQQGDLGLNQERALEYVLEGIRLIIALGEDDNPIVREHRAGLERTRGNILYARFYGDPFEMAQAAIAAHDLALEYTNERQSRLRGTIQLNRANAYARLARAERRHEQTAYYAYAEARDLLRDDRILAARASGAQASVMFTDTSLRAQAIDQLREAVSELKELGGMTAAAPQILQLGTWLVREATTSAQFQEAATILLEAIDAHAGRGDLTGAAHAALAASHAFSSASAHAEAAEQAQRSVRLAEMVWREATYFEDRVDAGALWSSANAQLLWCLGSREALSPDALWRLADQSKPPGISARMQQFAPSPSTLDIAYAGFDMNQRRLTAQRFRLQRERVKPDTSLAVAISELQDDASGLNEMLSLVGRQQRSATASEQVIEIIQKYPSIVIVDISVAESGSVVLVADAKGTCVHRVPMTRRVLTKAYSEWHSAYRNRREQPDAWHQSLDVFLAFLGEQLFSSVISDLRRAKPRELVIAFIPGILFGLPLHASAVNATRVCDLPLAFGYAATLRSLSLRGTAPRRSLCILSDNAAPPRQLSSPPHEIVAIAQTLIAADVHVTIIAQRGIEYGARVFATALAKVPSQATVLDQRPTPERILELLRESEHVFYTGHGIGGDQHGLVVSDENGEEVLLSTLELFEAEQMRAKTIILSACETAREPTLASAEPMSIAGSLLQLGAGFLLASSWVAIESVAAELCTTFHERWVRNEWDHLQAFAEALRELRASRFPTLSEWATFLPFIGVGVSVSEMQ